MGNRPEPAWKQCQSGHERAGPWRLRGFLRLAGPCCTTAAFLLALLPALGIPPMAKAQSTLGTPYAVAQLVKTACLFDTMNPAVELPRSHGALKAAGLAALNQTPTMAFYGDPAGSNFISNLTSDNNIACAATIASADLGKPGFDFLVQQIETEFRLRYGKHIFAPEQDSASWIARHGDGTKTVMSITYHPQSGTSITSIAALDD